MVKLIKGESFKLVPEDNIHMEELLENGWVVEKTPVQEKAKKTTKAKKAK